MAPMTSVVVIDDHPLFAEGTLEILGRLEGIHGVGYALGVTEAIALVLAAEPDVVLCDVMLGDSPAGLAVPARLSAQARTTPVIFLTHLPASALHARAIAAGGAGCLSKTISREELRTAILAVAGGVRILPRSASSCPGAPRSPSVREGEILTLVANGESNAKVGARLGISEKTVETHLSRLFQRYGAASRAQLVIVAERRGWLGAPD